MLLQYSQRRFTVFKKIIIIVEYNYKSIHAYKNMV